MDLFAAAKLPSTPPSTAGLWGRGVSALAAAGAWLGLGVWVAWAEEGGRIGSWWPLAVGGGAVVLGVVSGFVVRSAALLEERVHVAVVQLRFPPAELTSEQKARFWVIEDSRHPKPDTVDLSGRFFFMTPVLAAGMFVGGLFGPPGYLVAGIGGALGALAVLQAGVALLGRARALPMLGAVSRAQIAAMERGTGGRGIPGEEGS